MHARKSHRLSGWQRLSESVSESGSGVRLVVPVPAAGVAPAVAEILRLAAELPLEDLPELFAGLERARWVAQLRVGGGTAGQAITVRPLLTADQVGERLGISEPNVYRRAKTDLRHAAVEVGPGQLRFDADAIERFIEARRRL